MSHHLREAHRHIVADIARLEGVRDQLAAMLGGEIESAPAGPAAPGRRGKGKGRGKKKASKKKAGRPKRVKEAPAPKAAAATPAPAAAGESPRPGGRQPSPASAACRSAVLLALLAAPNAQSFTQLRDSIAGVMKKNGVADEEALTPILQMTQTVLRQKGLIERAAGAWKLTDVGRTEALRIRQAVKNAA